MKKIPRQGVPKATLLREAAASEWSDVISQVRAALATKIGASSPWDVDIEGMFSDHVVVCRDGRYFSYTYSIGADNVVTVGDPQEVIEQYVAARESVAVSVGAFIEAAGSDGGRWLIRVIRSGVSENNTLYPDAVLRESVPLFEGARVFQKSDQEHLKGGGKDVRNLIAGLQNPRFVEGARPDTGEIQADLVLIEPDGDVATKLREAYDRKLSSLFGFSIDADGKAKVELREGKKIRVATSITKVQSVDLIVEPGAGGELIRLIEARHPNEEKDHMREAMLKFLEAKHPKIYGRLSTEAADTEVEAAYREAVATDLGLADSAQPGAAVLAEVRLVEARMAARDLISGAKLPEPAKEKLLTRFTEAKLAFSAEDVRTAIEDERKYLARFAESGRVALGNLDIEVEDRSTKIADMFDAFFDPRHKDHSAVRSFRECYIEVTGDKRVTGQIEHCDRVRLRESVGAAFREGVDTTAFGNVLGASLRRAMIADYRSASEYDAWRQIVGNPVPLADFRTNERVRYGGYGDLPIVGQTAPYTALSTPSDEKASYAAAKRGGIETVTLEAIKNDDVGAIQRIPAKLSRAAKRTLAKFVFDFIRSNPVIYDTLALFHATHGNLFSGALSSSEFAAHRLAMLKMTEQGSADRLGVGPSFLLVPVDLQEAAWNLFQRNTNQDKTFIQSLVPTIIPVWYWTDANDWATLANPVDIPTIEIGFLDGQEEPELFIQDMPNVGSVFSNDQITYKLRHVYGGTVLDYRGMTKAVVA